MKAFLITGQGPIDAAQGSEAEASTGLVVKTRGELAKAVEQWPASRLIEFWNQIPGVQPVREFTSRTTALTRIGVTKPTAACCG